MIREARLLALALTVASTVALIGAAAPALIDQPLAERIARLPFRLFCHGIERRSLVLSGEAMSLCARCSGIFVGLAAGCLMSLPLMRRFRIPGWLPIVLLIPMIVDGGTQAIGFRESTNALRLMTGFTAATSAILWVITNIANERAAPTHS